MNTGVMTYVREIEAIGAVPKILETVASLTGVGFVAIAHVAETSWTACAVWDKLDFGLKAGDGLDVTTTLCEEMRSTRHSIVIDHVEVSEQYRDHRTPRIYGFQSYFSIPITRRDGSYFGTLCGLDPRPMTLSAPAMLSTLELFAELVSGQLETERLHAATQTDLSDERETAELREQFIAVLGHDLRTPLNALQNGVDLLGLKTRDDAMLQILVRMGRSVGRMSALVDDLVDFARGRMGGGIAVNLRREGALDLQLGQVIAELRDPSGGRYRRDHPAGHLGVLRCGPALPVVVQPGQECHRAWCRAGAGPGAGHLHGQAALHVGDQRRESLAAACRPTTVQALLALAFQLAPRGIGPGPVHRRGDRPRTPWRDRRDFAGRQGLFHVFDAQSGWRADRRGLTCVLDAAQAARRRLHRLRRAVRARVVHGGGDVRVCIRSHCRINRLPLSTARK